MFCPTGLGAPCNRRNATVHLTSFAALATPSERLLLPLQGGAGDELLGDLSMPLRAEIALSRSRELLQQATSSVITAHPTPAY